MNDTTVTAAGSSTGQEQFPKMREARPSTLAAFKAFMAAKAHLEACAQCTHNPSLECSVDRRQFCIVETNGNGPLQYAVVANDMDTLRALLIYGVRNNDSVRSRRVNSPLITAMIERNREAIEELLKHDGVNLNDALKIGVHSATEDANFDLELIDLLVKVYEKRIAQEEGRGSRTASSLKSCYSHALTCAIWNGTHPGILRHLVFAGRETLTPLLSAHNIDVRDLEQLYNQTPELFREMLDKGLVFAAGKLKLRHCSLAVLSCLLDRPGEEIVKILDGFENAVDQLTRDLCSLVKDPSCEQKSCQLLVEGLLRVCKAQGTSEGDALGQLKRIALIAAEKCEVEGVLTKLIEAIEHCLPQVAGSSNGKEEGPRPYVACVDPEDKGARLLFCAARAGNTVTCKELIALGEDPLTQLKQDASDNSFLRGAWKGLTPLHFAVALHDPSCAEILMEAVKGAPMRVPVLEGDSIDLSFLRHLVGPKDSSLAKDLMLIDGRYQPIAAATATERWRMLRARPLSEQGQTDDVDTHENENNPELLPKHEVELIRDMMMFNMWKNGFPAADNAVDRAELLEEFDPVLQWIFLQPAEAIFRQVVQKLKPGATEETTQALMVTGFGQDEEVTDEALSAANQEVCKELSTQADLKKFKETTLVQLCYQTIMRHANTKLQLPASFHKDRPTVRLIEPLTPIAPQALPSGPIEEFDHFLREGRFMGLAVARTIMGARGLRPLPMRAPTWGVFTGRRAMRSSDPQENPLCDPAYESIA